MKISIDEYSQGLYKSVGGLIRVFLREDVGSIEEVIFTGDFFIFPDESLGLMADSLKGIALEKERIEGILREVYIREGIDSPGTTPEDFAKAVMTAAR
ncbi:MAG: lipoate protein ligase C-terminal domain-containing protein [Candidatus Altiarchaeota archaeon]|nr:lipoate protein ligase C-terminal domain-containing protein [Candidatus Altiarchaeota archaeon]